MNVLGAVLEFVFMPFSASFAQWFLKCSSLTAPFLRGLVAWLLVEKSPITVMFMRYSTDKHILKECCFHRKLEKTFLKRHS